MPPILGIWASAFAKATPDTGSYFPLGEFTISSAQSTIEFTNIPQTYTHLQVRAFIKTSRSAYTDYLIMRMNGDTGANYKAHAVYGDGTSPFAESFNNIELGSCAGSTLSNTFSTSIIDILDYKNTNKNTVIRNLNGLDTNGNGQWVGITSGVWLNTAAVTSLRFTSGLSSNFAVGTNFSLYGVLA